MSLSIFYPRCTKILYFVYHKQITAQSQIRIESFGLLRHRLKFALDDLLEVVQSIGEAVPFFTGQACDVQTADRDRASSLKLIR